MLIENVPLPWDSEQKRIETIRRLCATQPGLIERSGFVLTNGWRTLAPGDIYVMGLNPGGESKSHAQYTVGWSLGALTDDQDGLEFGGNPRFATNVRTMVKALVPDPASVFMTNAIFERTSTANELSGRALELFDASWPMHAWFLSIVRPKVILCLGNNSGHASATSLLARKAGIEWSSDVQYGSGSPSKSRFRDGCWFRCHLPIADGETLPVTVLGAPHPSRFPVTNAWLDLAGRIRAEDKHPVTDGVSPQEHVLAPQEG